MLVTLALLLVATGSVFLLIVRRRGLYRAVGIVVILAVGATVLTFSGVSRADADSCTSAAPAVAAAVATTTTTTADPLAAGAVAPIVTSPGVALPETPLVAAFPVVGLILISGYLVMRHRRNEAVTR